MLTYDWSDWLHFDQDNPFLKKYVQRRPHTKFLKDLCSILIDVPVFHRTRLYRTPLESYTTEVLTIYFPPSTLATKPVSDISRRFHLMFEAGSPMINNEGWHTLPIHRMDYDWVEDYVPHKGQLARAFVVCTDWRNAEAERSFKYESGQDFTNFFRAPGTSLEGLQWEDTTTYEGFLKHLSPLGYERHYIPFQRLRRDTFRDKKCCNCIIQ